MKKLICLVTVIALTTVALIGCGKKEPYLGTYKYDHCTYSTTNTYLKLLVEEMAEVALEDSNIYLEENGKAYSGIGCKDVEYTYI